MTGVFIKLYDIVSLYDTEKACLLVCFLITSYMLAKVSEKLSNEQLWPCRVAERSYFDRRSTSHH